MTATEVQETKKPTLKSLAMVQSAKKKISGSQNVEELTPVFIPDDDIMNFVVTSVGLETDFGYDGVVNGSASHAYPGIERRAFDSDEAFIEAIQATPQFSKRAEEGMADLRTSLLLKSESVGYETDVPEGFSAPYAYLRIQLGNNIIFYSSAKDKSWPSNFAKFLENCGIVFEPKRTYPLVDAQDSINLDALLGLHFKSQVETYVPKRFQAAVDAAESDAEKEEILKRVTRFRITPAQVLKLTEKRNKGEIEQNRTLFAEFYGE